VVDLKTILIGSVESSKIVLEEMIAQHFPPEMVFSLDEQYSAEVSGYFPIHEIAEKNNIPCRKFKKINDLEHTNTIVELKPDYIFVIGLSQLVSKKLIQSAKLGTIGFHPTPLPKYRGRAAVVWQILLGVRKTKCSLFLIDEGMDSGDIIGQEEYLIEPDDYALDVTEKVGEALRRLLRCVLPQVKNGTLNPVKQNEEDATYLLKRIPEDGQINWNDPVEKIHTLIRATSKPYPGAFANYDGDHKVIFWRADVIENKKYTGIPGQIAYVEKDSINIVCGDGLLRLYEYDNIDNVKIITGHKFK
jgi:methionyl-tRNA formyltransferase